MVDRGRADGCRPGRWLVGPRQGGRVDGCRQAGRPGFASRLQLCQGQVKEHHRRDANFVETSREPQRESVPLRAEATADPRTDREQRRRYTVPLAQPHTDTRNKKRAEHDVVSHRTVCEEIPDRQSSTRLHRHRQACSARAARDGTAARST
ncbi:unnamed protein product [Gadus morhua 'NCC']